MKTERGLFKHPVSKLVMLLPEDEDTSTGVIFKAEYSLLIVIINIDLNCY